MPWGQQPPTGPRTHPKTPGNILATVPGGLPGTTAPQNLNPMMAQFMTPYYAMTGVGQAGMPLPGTIPPSRIQGFPASAPAQLQPVAAPAAATPSAVPEKAALEPREVPTALGDLNQQRKPEEKLSNENERFNTKEKVQEALDR